MVEDTQDNQILIRLFLAKTGALVDFANNGQDAIEQTQKKSYDLILMDIQMPIMDGYSATEEIRKQGYTAPIIAMTGNAMKKDKEKCYDVGCSDYISKPFEREYLLQTIAKYI